MNGWKSYIVAALIAIVTLLHAQGIIGTELYKLLIGLLGAGGVATLKHASYKAEVAAKDAAVKADLAAHR